MKKEEQKFSDSNILEGMTSIRALIKAREAKTNDRPIKTVFYDKAKEASKKRELDYIRSMAAHHGYKVVPSDKEEIDNITIGSTHGGIIAVCGDRTIPDISSLEKQVTDGGFYILIEGIEDPYNFGYALRSVYAAGADGIILPPRNWMGAAGVVARASAGASELFSMYTGDPIDAVNIFKSKGYKIICADMRNSCSIYTADMKRPLFLIIGGEKRGISRSILDACDLTVRIEYGRHFPASLSAASATAIIAYEVFRQNTQNK